MAEQGSEPSTPTSALARRSYLGVVAAGAVVGVSGAIEKLAGAVEELCGWLAPVHLTPVTRDYFGALVDATNDRRFARAIEMLLHARSSPARDRAARGVVARSCPWLHSALLRTTAAFVIEDAGYEENVIPSTAHLRVNCRGIPGGQKPQSSLAQVRSRLRDRHIHIALATPEGISETDLSWSRSSPGAVRGRHQPESVAQEGHPGVRRVSLRDQQR